MANSVEQIKPFVLWFLKENGEITDAKGNAQLRLSHALAPYLPEVGPSRFVVAMRELDNDGYILRKTSGKGRKIYGIRLVHTGDYPNPLADGVEPAVEESSPAPVERVPPTRKSGKNLDRIIGDIQKLPLPEKLMLAGMIVDGCAGEVDETFTRLREVVGRI